MVCPPLHDRQQRQCIKCELIGFRNGTTPAPSFDRTAIDGLLDEVENTIDTRSAKPKVAMTATEHMPEMY
jgi:hypothetical protein